MTQKVPSQSELIWNEQQKFNQAIFLALNEVMQDDALLNLPHILEQAEILKQYHLTYKSLSKQIQQSDYLFIALRQNNIQNKNICQTIENMIHKLLNKQTARVPSNDYEKSYGTNYNWEKITVTKRGVPANLQQINRTSLAYNMNDESMKSSHPPAVKSRSRNPVRYRAPA